MHRPPLPPGKYPWYSFLLEAELTPGPGNLCQCKIPVKPLRMEPATFRLVAQCLNQMRHRVPTARNDVTCISCTENIQSRFEINKRLILNQVPVSLLMLLL